MNRRYLLIDKICPYLMSLSNQACNLKTLDLSDNALGSKEVQKVLESIEFVSLTKLDLSFNYLGHSTSKQLLMMLETARCCDISTTHLFQSIEHLSLKSTHASFAKEEIHKMFDEIWSLKTLDLRFNSNSTVTQTQLFSFLTRDAVEKL